MKASKLIAKILMLCGVSLTCTSCYGVPRATFELKLNGNVTDGLGYPVEGIEVSVRPAGSQYSYTVPGKTDPSGDYAIIGQLLDGTREFEVVAEDVDGDDGGGHFAADTVTINIAASDYEGGDNKWYRKATKTADFELKLKQRGDEGE